MAEAREPRHLEKGFEAMYAIKSTSDLQSGIKGPKGQTAYEGMLESTVNMKHVSWKLNIPAAAWKLGIAPLMCCAPSRQKVDFPKTLQRF